MTLSEPSYTQKNTSLVMADERHRYHTGHCMLGNTCSYTTENIFSVILILSETLLLYKDFNAILRKQNRHSFIAKICIEEYGICILHFKNAMARNGFDFEEESY